MRSRLLRAAPLLAAILLSHACTAKGEGTAEVEGGLAPGPSATVPPDTLPERLSRTLVGTIGGRAVTLDVRVEDGDVTGWIRPAGPAGTDRFEGPWLSGSLDAGGAVALDEHAEEGGVRATLTGRFALEGGRLVLEGERTPAGGGAPETVRLEEAGLALGGGARLVSRDVRIADSARGVEFYAEAPRVAGPDGGPPADPALARLDAALRERVESARESFVETFGVTEPDTLVERRIRQTGPSWYEASYDAWLAADSILGVETSVSTYGSGAAHPNHHTETLVWDLEAGRAVALEDLFRPGTGWLETVSERAVAELTGTMGEMGDEAWIREGAGPDPANFSAWSVIPEGIRIVFDPYQVAPYAAGPQTIVVPWPALAWVLDPAGPVAAPGAGHVPSGAATGP